MKAIILDDEIKAIYTLQKLLQLYVPEIHVVGATDKQDSAYEMILSAKPDVLFLDIEMPYETGFDFLHRFKTRTFEVIFTTAYDQFGIKAIKEKTFDYILKPIDKDELIKSVDSLKGKLAEKAKLNRAESPLGIITFPVTGGFITLNNKDIIKLQADGSYTTIFTLDGKKHTSSYALQYWEEKLPAHFFRVHHSHLINLNNVVQYVSGRGGYVILTDGSHVDVAQRKKTEFLEKMGK